MAIVLIAISALPCSVSAAGMSVSYEDYSSIIVDGDNQLVTVSFPVSWAWMGLYNTADSSLLNASSGAALIYGIDQNIPNVFLYCAPFGTYFNPFTQTSGYSGRYLDLSDIPSGATYSLSLSYGFWNEASSLTNYAVRFASASYNNGVVVPTTLWPSITTVQDRYRYRIDVSSTFPAGAEGWMPFFQLNANQVGLGTLYFTLESFTVSFTITALFQLQQQTGKTNQILTEVEKQLEQQGKTMEDILNQQEQTNDKLDKLPGQIGDEMQGVIESEKEQSKMEGNEFVDQILDALPDPSQDVLRALGALTDSMAYTGTDAVLSIPSLVLPGIDGLFPETEIWGGTEFSFSDYLGFLPENVLTLVQSLFTIAIVLFCVYELKDIISFVFTLNKLHKGDFD